MEWLTSIRAAIDYMEANLHTIQSTAEVAQAVYISPFYLQKGFSVMTGFSMAEYIRNRRLYQAALDVLAGREKVIDIALKYGYDTPESFTRAFTRFHGHTPSQVRDRVGDINVFLPLKISIEIKGGSSMDYIVERMPALRLIGFARRVNAEMSYTEIPEFWDEVYEKHLAPLLAGKQPETGLERAICDCRVGMYGLCIDHDGADSFQYLIAGDYNGVDVPEGMSVYELPAMEWAKFLCKGPLPSALQSINTKIFREWLPANAEFDLAFGANIEWYAPGDPKDPDYESAIWVPVKHK